MCISHVCVADAGRELTFITARAAARIAVLMAPAPMRPLLPILTVLAFLNNLSPAQKRFLLE